MTQAPSLGRIVLYMANGGVNPPYPEPGLIVHVYGGGNALAVKANSIILVSFDTYGQVLPHAMVPYSEGKEMGTWHWPPRSDAPKEIPGVDAVSGGPAGLPAQRGWSQSTPPSERTQALLLAGQACLDWMELAGECHLCGDYNKAADEPHNPECPLFNLPKET